VDEFPKSWPRSELENYFLEPDLLARSSYLKPRFSKERIADEILRLFNTRIYFDIANLTILRLREKLKEKWIDLFRDPLPFKNQKDALGILLARQEFREKSRVTSTHLSKMFVSSLFTEICRDCFGGSTELKLEQGRWLELVNGKEAMRSVMNTCFSVRAEGVDIQGERKFTTIARDLVSSVPIAEQPADFRRLKELLTEKLK